MLASYRLAKFFGTHPREFLNDPVSMIASHLRYVNKLLDELSEQEEESN